MTEPCWPYSTQFWSGIELTVEEDMMRFLKDISLYNWENSLQNHNVKLLRFGWGFGYNPPILFSTLKSLWHFKDQMKISLTLQRPVYSKCAYVSQKKDEELYLKWGIHYILWGKYCYLKSTSVSKKKYTKIKKQRQVIHYPTFGMTLVCHFLGILSNKISYIDLQSTIFPRCT